MYEVYAFWGGQGIYDNLNSVVRVIGGGGFASLARTIALVALLVAVTYGFLAQRGSITASTLMAIVLGWTLLLVPRVNVGVIDVRTNQIRTVDNVPIGLAAPYSLISTIGRWLTTQYETNFSMVNDERFSQSGMVFGARINELASQQFLPTELDHDMRSFYNNCVAPELLDGNTAFKIKQILNSPDVLNTLQGSGFLNPGRGMVANTVYVGSASVGQREMSCTQFPAALQQYITSNYVNRNAFARIALQSGNYTLMQNATLASLVENDANNYFSRLTTMSRNAEQTLQQLMVINTLSNVSAVEYGYGDALSTSHAVSVADASLRNSSYAGKLWAEKSLPLARNVFEIIIIACWPLMFLAALVAGERMLSTLGLYCKVLLSLSLWAPLTAVVNGIVVRHGQEAMSAMLQGSGGYTFNNATALINHHLDIQAIAGQLFLTIPVIAYGLATAGAYAMTAAMGAVTSTASSATGAHAQAAATGSYSGGQISWGNVSAGNTSTNNRQANSSDTGVKFTDPGKSTFTDAYGQDIKDRSSGNRAVASSINESNLGVSATAARSSGIDNTSVSGFSTASTNGQSASFGSSGAASKSVMASDTAASTNAATISSNSTLSKDAGSRSTAAAGQTSTQQFGSNEASNMSESVSIGSNVGIGGSAKESAAGPGGGVGGKNAGAGAGAGGGRSLGSAVTAGIQGSANATGGNAYGATNVQMSGSDSRVGNESHVGQSTSEQSSTGLTDTSQLSAQRTVTGTQSTSAETSRGASASVTQTQTAGSNTSQGTRAGYEVSASSSPEVLAAATEMYGSTAAARRALSTPEGRAALMDQMAAQQSGSPVTQVAQQGISGPQSQEAVQQAGASQVNAVAGQGRSAVAAVGAVGSVSSQQYTRPGTMPASTDAAMQNHTDGVSGTRGSASATVTGGAAQQAITGGAAIAANHAFKDQVGGVSVASVAFAGGVGVNSSGELQARLEQQATTDPVMRGMLTQLNENPRNEELIKDIGSRMK